MRICDCAAPGLVHQHDLALGQLGRNRQRCGRPARAARRPAGERLVEFRLHARQCHVTGDDDRRVAGGVVLLVERADLVGGDRLDHRTQPGGRRAIAIGRPEHHTRKRVSDDLGRVVPRLDERREPLFLQALKLVCGEGGAKYDVGEEPQRGRQVLDRHREPHGASSRRCCWSRDPRPANPPRQQDRERSALRRLHRASPRRDWPCRNARFGRGCCHRA